MAKFLITRTTTTIRHSTGEVEISPEAEGYAEMLASYEKNNLSTADLVLRHHVTEWSQPREDKSIRYSATRKG